MKEWSAISKGSPVTSLRATKAKNLASSVTGWSGNRLDLAESPLVRRMERPYRSIAISPITANVIYIGATDGGIWKTIDAGANWTPLTDHEPMLAIGEPAR